MYRRQRPDAPAASAGIRAGDRVVAVDGTAVKSWQDPVSYTHLRAHETGLDLVSRLLLGKKNRDVEEHQWRRLISASTL